MSKGDLLHLFKENTGKTVIVPPVEKFKPKWFSPRVDEIDRRVI
jgi:hypothetical protein